MKKIRESFTKENAAKVTFGICAGFSILAVFAIVFFVLYRSIPAFREIGVFNFLFGKNWQPRWEEDVVSGELGYGDIFGVLPMILTTLAVTGGAVLLGGVLGIFTAVFMAFYCPKNLERTPLFKRIPILRRFPVKGFFEQVVNLLASIPSIIIGFFGLVVLVPLVQKLSPRGEGMGVLSAILVLAIMIMPTIASLAKNSMESVSKEYYEGALGLGNTKDQTVFRVMLPSAKPGILSAIILGVGRAVGETMAVMFVIGGASGKMPDSLFKPVGSLTTTIAKEMGYVSVGSVHESALIAIGFVLLVFVLFINLALNAVKKDRPGGNKLFGGRLQACGDARRKIYTYRQCGASQRVLKYLSVALSLFIAFVLLFLVGFICVKGIPHLSWHFLFGESKNGDATIFPAFVSTGMIILMTLLIALPIGIGAAVFLNEYSKKGSRFVKVVRLFIDTLSGVPSIVFGLFGMIFFCDILGFGYSLWAGSFTMVLIVLPTIIRSTEESLREVPDSMREGSLALGASKVRTVFKVVLPSALRGIVTSIILSIGRIVGESAALIYTSGSPIKMPEGYGSQGSTFSVFMYYFQQEGLALDEMYATAAVLIAIVVLLDVLVTLARRKFSGAGGEEKKGRIKGCEKFTGKAAAERS